MPLWTSNYPVALDAFSATPQIDLIDVVWANNVNIPATSIEALEAKLGITAGVATGFGGFSFDSAGKAAFPGVLGNPTLWVDNSGGPGYILVFTDELGTDWNLMSLSNIGVGYTVADPLIAVGDIVSIDPAGADDNAVRADARVGSPYPAFGVVISIYGAGTLCDIAYYGEIQNAAWTGLFPIGTAIYLGAPGVTSGLSTVPPGGIGSLQQEVGFFRNTDTLVFRPTLVSVV
jgi:hypothetical protein